MRSPISAGALIDLFRDARTLDDLQKVLSRYLDDIGFSRFAFELKRGTPQVNSVLSMLSNYPGEFIDRYIAEQYRQDDLVHVRAHRVVTPFGWSDMLKQHPVTARTGTLFAEAGEFGIRDGLTVPIRGHGNTISIFSAVPDGIRPERELALRRHSADLTMVAALLHERIWHLHEQERAATHERELLTQREREVLQWIGGGKTSYEIGIILSITEATVNSHIATICRKMNASSRTQAAVIGAMQGLIDPC